MRRILVTFLAVVSAWNGQSVTAQQVQHPSGKLPTKVAVDPTSEAPILVWLAYEGFAPYILPDVKEKRVQHKPGLQFMEAFFLGGNAPQNENDFHLLVRSEDAENIKEDGYVGWVQGKYLVRQPRAMTVKGTKMHQKALVVNRLETFGKETKLDVMTARFAPTQEKGIGENEGRRLYTIMFVYGRADDHVLLGDAPSFNPKHTPKKLAEYLVGWVPKHRVAEWDTREAIEWDHHATLEPKHRRPYLTKSGEAWDIKTNKPIKELARRTRIGRIYSSLADAEAGLTNPNTKGIFEEYMDEDEILQYTVSPPLGHDAPRFPVFEVVKEIQSPTAGRLFKVGAIGGLCDSKGKVILPSRDAVQLQKILTSIRNETRQTDILFVIDDTESMRPWFPDVAQTVKDITNLATKEKREVRVAIAFYNDEKFKPDKRPTTIVYPLEDVIESGEKIAAKVTAHKRDGGGDAWEMLYRGLVEGIEGAKFNRQQARKMVIVLGDCGDISDPLAERADAAAYAKKFHLDAIINKVIPPPHDLGNVTPMEFYAIQVMNTDTPNAATAAYEKQMKALAEKYNQVLSDNWKKVLQKKFDATRVQKAQYFPPTGINHDSIGRVLQLRYTRLLEEGKKWEEALTRLRNGQWVNTVVTPDMEAAIDQKLRNLRTPDGKPVTLEMLKESGGLQVFQEGYAWEFTPQGLPLIRRRVLLNDGELGKLTKMLGELRGKGNTAGKQVPISKLMANVITKQTGDDDPLDPDNWDHLSAWEVKKHWAVLKFNNSILTTAYNKLTLDEKDKVRRPKNQDLHKLFHVHDLLTDVQKKKLCDYEATLDEIAGGEKVWQYHRKGGDKAGKDVYRGFQIGKDNELIWYYLDYDREWP